MSTMKIMGPFLPDCCQLFICYIGGLLSAYQMLIIQNLPALSSNRSVSPSTHLLLCSRAITTRMTYSQQTSCINFISLLTRSVLLHSCTSSHKYAHPRLLFHCFEVCARILTPLPACCLARCTVPSMIALYCQYLYVYKSTQLNSYEALKWLAMSSKEPR